ncbi:MAG TPA: TrmB family transcriptional regulator [Candidatus Pacearchaeota archaeon]|nr:sugar-specific transcriptional regulator TrmB [archaeon BMS3Abin17]HDK42817.1 TrmB family transcriptional regulator [Candidatus Pacearchaeota archaeon]HDZ61364.1 TrmB family transcriptional regulator [Candidatus Pacearchaeota archaeon]
MLEKFGLTQTEEKVYLALLKLGNSPAADIIKKTQLHRTTIYDVLERLISKGIVSYVIQNKIKSYSSVNPSKFLDIASEEKKQAEEKQKLAKQIIGEINSIKQEAKAKSLAQIFVGIQGQKTIMQDIIDEGKDFIEFASEGRFEDVLSAYTKQWAVQREKKNIKAKLIFKKGVDTPIWKMNKIKFIKEEYQSPTATIVYGNKVAIFIHEEPVLIILIESKQLAQSYCNYFKILWSIAED